MMDLTDGVLVQLGHNHGYLVEECAEAATVADVVDVAAIVAVAVAVGAIALFVTRVGG